MVGVIDNLFAQLNDNVSAKICEHFPQTTKWIKEALDGGGKVLVNCFQGASRYVKENSYHFYYYEVTFRSATVVLAYLIQEKKMTVEEAIVCVKKKRDVRPNNAFLQQLIDLSDNV